MVNGAATPTPEMAHRRQPSSNRISASMLPRMVKSALPIVTGADWTLPPLCRVPAGSDGSMSSVGRPVKYLRCWLSNLAKIPGNGPWAKLHRSTLRRNNDRNAGPHSSGCSVRAEPLCWPSDLTPFRESPGPQPTRGLNDRSPGESGSGHQFESSNCVF